MSDVLFNREIPKKHSKMFYYYIVFVKFNEFTLFETHSKFSIFFPF